jgi:hypothetical protein
MPRTSIPQRPLQASDGRNGTVAIAYLTETAYGVSHHDLTCPSASTHHRRPEQASEAPASRPELLVGVVRHIPGELGVAGDAI